MKKQTALELFKQRLVQRGIGYNIKDFEEAKEMERIQMKEMYLKGIENYDPTFKKKA